MNFIKKNWIGILVCFIIAVPSWLIGKRFPVVGGPIIAILAGMLIALVWTDKGKAEAGIKWTSKIVLQTAVVLLGFGMNLGVILQTGKQSLPIIICTDRYILIDRMDPSKGDEGSGKYFDSCRCWIFYLWWFRNRSNSTGYRCR